MLQNLMIGLLAAGLIVGGSIATSTINSLKSTIAMMAVSQKKQLVKTKLKERGKRLVAAVPIAGMIAVGWFEKREYDAWRAEHPDGTFCAAP